MTGRFFGSQHWPRGLPLENYGNSAGFLGMTLTAVAKQLFRVCRSQKLR